MATNNPNSGGFFSGGPSGSSSGDSTVDLYVTSGVVNGENLVLTLSNQSTVTISLSDVFNSGELTGITFNASNGTLTVNQGGRSFSTTIPTSGDEVITSSITFDAATSELVFVESNGSTFRTPFPTIIEDIVTNTGTVLTVTTVGNRTRVTLPDFVTQDELTNDLAGKQDTLTGTDDVPGLTSALNDKQDTLSDFSDVPGLETELATKQDNIVDIATTPQTIIDQIAAGSTGEDNTIEVIRTADGVALPVNTLDESVTLPDFLEEDEVEEWAQVGHLGTIPIGEIPHTNSISGTDNTVVPTEAAVESALAMKQDTLTNYTPDVWNAKQDGITDVDTTPQTIRDQISSSVSSIRTAEAFGYTYAADVANPLVDTDITTREAVINLIGSEIDDALVQQVIDELLAPGSTFVADIAADLATDDDFLAALGASSEFVGALVANAAFLSALETSLSNSATFQAGLATALSTNTAFIDALATNTVFIAALETALVASAEFQQGIADALAVNDAFLADLRGNTVFIEALATAIVNDPTAADILATALLGNAAFISDIQAAIDAAVSNLDINVDDIVPVRNFNVNNSILNNAYYRSPTNTNDLYLYSGTSFPIWGTNSAYTANDVVNYLGTSYTYIGADIAADSGADDPVTAGTALWTVGTAFVTPENDPTNYTLQTDSVKLAAAIDALEVPVITETNVATHGPSNFILTDALLTGVTDFIGRYDEGPLQIEVEAATQRTSNTMGVTPPGNIALVIRDAIGIDVRVIEDAITINASGNISPQVINLDLSAVDAAQELHFNFRFPLGTTGIQYGWSDFQATIGQVAEIDALVREVLRDELSVTTVAANPDGTDGDSLARVSIDGTNFNLAGGVEVLATDPTSLTEGLVWYNSTDDVVRYYDGTTVQTVVDESFYNANTGITVHHAVSGTPVNANFSGTSGNTRAGTLAITTPGDYTIATTIEITSIISNFAQGQWRLTLTDADGTSVGSRNITVNSDNTAEATKNLVVDGLTAQTYTLTATLTAENNHNVGNWTISARAEDNDHDSVDVDPLVYEDLDTRYLQSADLSPYRALTDQALGTVPFRSPFNPDEWSSIVQPGAFDRPIVLEDAVEIEAFPTVGTPTTSGFASFGAVLADNGTNAVVLADSGFLSGDDDVYDAYTLGTTAQLTFYVGSAAVITVGERIDIVQNNAQNTAITTDFSVADFIVDSVQTIGSFQRVVADSTRDARRATALTINADIGSGVAGVDSFLTAQGIPVVRFVTTASIDTGGGESLADAYLQSYDIHEGLTRFAIPLAIRDEDYDRLNGNGLAYPANPVPRHIIDGLQNAGTLTATTHLGDLTDVDTETEEVAEAIDPVDTNNEVIIVQADADNAYALELVQTTYADPSLTLLVDRQSPFQAFDTFVVGSKIHVPVGDTPDSDTEYFSLFEAPTLHNATANRNVNSTAVASNTITVNIPPQFQPAVSVGNASGTALGSPYSGAVGVLDVDAQTVTFTLTVSVTDGTLVSANFDITYVDTVELNGTPTQALADGIRSVDGVVTVRETIGSSFDALHFRYDLLTAAQIGSESILALEDGVAYELPTGHFWRATTNTEDSASVIPRSEHDALVDREEALEARIDAIIAASHHEWQGGAMTGEYDNSPDPVNNFFFAVNEADDAIVVINDSTDHDGTADDGTYSTVTIQRDGVYGLTWHFDRLVYALSTFGRQIINFEVRDVSDDSVLATFPGTVTLTDTDSVVQASRDNFSIATTANFLSGTEIYLNLAISSESFMVPDGSTVPELTTFGINQLGGFFTITTTQEGIGGGAEAFTNLTDTPSTLGTAGQVVRVNSVGSALEFTNAIDEFSDLAGNVSVLQLPEHNVGAGFVMQTTATANRWEIVENSGSGQGVASGTALPLEVGTIAELFVLTADTSLSDEGLYRRIANNANLGDWAYVEQGLRTWVSNHSYVFNDIVRYAVDNKIYAVTGTGGSITGTLPTSTSVWTEVSATDNDEVDARIALTEIDGLNGIPDPANGTGASSRQLVYTVADETFSWVDATSGAAATINVTSSTAIAFRIEEISGVTYTARLYELNDGMTTTFAYNARRRAVDRTVTTATDVTIASLAAFNALDLEDDVTYT